ncbi:hypothetical protein TrVE_jg7710 [Triparma verrucosa]|uniref:PA domain-containing protein n=1 Tax=Triparma verrucosa TaxID=1606542 RepID=A0A9W7BCU9_9STRA|nr:hypothetical protein TrVE_jg7710 [Triparma verrucosa]
MGDEEINAADLRRAGIITDAELRAEDRGSVQRSYIVNEEEAKMAADMASERKPSMVKLPGREEMLMLPDRESVLKFEFFRDFAKEEDIDGQLEQREQAWWGRLYVANFPFSIQFLRGHFGSGPKLAQYTLLLSEPALMCDLTLYDAMMDNQDRVKELKDQGKNVIIVAKRGNCTYGEKAILAESVGADGILYVNDEEGITHPAAPDVREFRDFAPSMISKAEGDYLMNVLQRGGGTIEANFIPIACVDEPKNLKTDKFCLPTSQQERDFEDAIQYGGVAKSSDGIEADFLQAHYGYPLPDGTHSFTLHEGDACESLGEETVSKHVIVKRGGCSFQNKTLNLAEAGAEVIVIVNNEPFPDRPGVGNLYESLVISSSVVMVGAVQGDAIWKSMKGNGGVTDLTFARDENVRYDIYRQLAALVRKPIGDDGGFPFKKKARATLMEDTKKEMKAIGVTKGLWEAYKAAAKKGGVKVSVEL